MVQTHLLSSLGEGSVAEGKAGTGSAGHL